MCEQVQTSKIYNQVKFLVHQKWVMDPSWCPQLFFFVGHELEHAQEALDMCQMQYIKNTTRVACTAKMSIADLFPGGILGNLLMTLIDLVN